MVPAPAPEQLARRAELLSHCGPDDAPELARLTEDLGAMMRSDRLLVRRLTLSEPAEVLQRLVAAEPVHPFDGPDDVADRLDEDRRCFVLEHPDLPGRPLNVVWCALWRGVPRDLAAVLDRDAPTEVAERADTAAFYSIWNVEPGLVGLPGGRTLLLGAVEALRRELPGLSTFVTLSPVPGLRGWLAAQDRLPLPDDELPAAAATYLTTLRDDGRPIDPVARFHLGNGARLLSLCPAADRSRRGMDRSLGLMANYRYAPEDRDANVASLGRGQVALGDEVAALLAAEGSRGSERS